MGHTIAEKEKLLGRVRSLKSHLGAMESGFRDSIEPAALLRLVAQSRSQINGLMSEILEDHLRAHVLHKDCGTPDVAYAAAEELIEVVHAYMGQ